MILPPSYSLLAYLLVAILSVFFITRRYAAVCLVMPAALVIVFGENSKYAVVLLAWFTAVLISLYESVEVF